MLEEADILNSWILLLILTFWGIMFELLLGNKKELWGIMFELLLDNKKEQNINPVGTFYI